MEKFIVKYRKLLRRQKLFTVCYIVFMALELLGTLAGIIISGITGTDSLLTISVILFIVGPLVLVFFHVFVIRTLQSNKRKELDAEIYDSELNADEIMQVGAELKISLFSVALKKRVFELGLDFVPEGCIRDEILPTKKD